MPCAEENTLTHKAQEKGDIRAVKRTRSVWNVFVFDWKLHIFKIRSFVDFLCLLCVCVWQVWFFLFVKIECKTSTIFAWLESDSIGRRIGSIKTLSRWFTGSPLAPATQANIPFRTQPLTFWRHSSVPCACNSLTLIVVLKVKQCRSVGKIGCAGGWWLGNRCNRAIITHSVMFSSARHNSCMPLIGFRAHRNDS